MNHLIDLTDDDWDIVIDFCMNGDHEDLIRIAKEIHKQIYIDEPMFTERQLFESYGLDYDKIKDKEASIKGAQVNGYFDKEVPDEVLPEWMKEKDEIIGLD